VLKIFFLPRKPCQFSTNCY